MFEIADAEILVCLVKTARHVEGVPTKAYNKKLNKCTFISASETIIKFINLQLFHILLIVLELFRLL